jgi:hypothetical protein
MKKSLYLFAGLMLCLLAAAPPASAGTLSGVVRNGTTGSVVSGQDVILISLQGGMQPVATVKTDAQGRYNFDRPEIGGGPLLVRVPYRNVNYHQSVPPGTATADVEVFEPTASFASLALVNHVIIFQPNGAVLVVGEEFSIHNLSKPMATYDAPGGSFEFVIPDGATLGRVTASGPAGMPLEQGTIDKSKNRYGVVFALKPGENTIRVAYELPYTGNQASLKAVSPMAAQRVVLAGPQGIQISSDGFAPAGTEQGYAFLSRDSVAANSPVAVSVSGTASAPAAAGTGGGDARDSGAAPAADSANVTVVPPRVASVQYILIAGFVLMFALGAVYLWRQPRAVVAADGSAGLSPAPGFESSPGPSQRKRKQSRDASPALASAAPVAHSTAAAAAPIAAPPSVSDIDRAVHLSLDELKDAFFRLELRHQAGTISEEEYARERARMEGVLRNLVRG